MQRLIWAIAVFFMVAFQLPASPCVAGNTLDTYIALGVTGCTIGPQTVNNFSFSVFSTTGSVTLVSDTDITVTPTFGSGSYGIVFASSGFVTGAGTVDYLLGYTWDSIPIRGMEDALDPPTNVDIVTSGCEGVAFVGTSCSGTETSVDVNPGQLTDSVSFTPTTILGISNSISLSENASFGSIETDASVTPEPASFLFAAFGLAILAAGIRLRRASLLR